MTCAVWLLAVLLLMVAGIIASYRHKQWLAATVQVRADLPRPHAWQRLRVPKGDVTLFSAHELPAGAKKNLHDAALRLLERKRLSRGERAVLERSVKAALGVLSAAGERRWEVRDASCMAWRGYVALGYKNLVEPFADWISKQWPSDITMLSEAADAYQSQGATKAAVGVLTEIVQLEAKDEGMGCVNSALERLLKHRLTRPQMELLLRRAEGLIEKECSSPGSCFFEVAELCGYRFLLLKRLGRKATSPALEYFLSRDWTRREDWKEAPKHIARLVAEAGSFTLDFLGDHAIHDINRDGLLEILVHNVCAGTGGYHNLWICGFDKTTGKLWTDTIMLDKAGLESLRDIDGDGRLEIVAPQTLWEYRGAEGINYWPDIYRWNAKERSYEEASPHYLQFYRKVVLAKFRNLKRETKRAGKRRWGPDEFMHDQAVEMLEHGERFLKKHRAVKPQYPCHPSPSPLRVRSVPDFGSGSG